MVYHVHSGEHQYELLDYVAAKFYEESGVFKLLVMFNTCMLPLEQVYLILSFLWYFMQLLILLDKF